MQDSGRRQLKNGDRELVLCIAPWPEATRDGDHLAEAHARVTLDGVLLAQRLEVGREQVVGSDTERRLSSVGGEPNWIIGAPTGTGVTAIDATKQRHISRAGSPVSQ